MACDTAVAVAVAVAEAGADGAPVLAPAPAVADADAPADAPVINTCQRQTRCILSTVNLQVMYTMIRCTSVLATAVADAGTPADAPVALPGCTLAWVSCSTPPPMMHIAGAL